MSKSYIVNMNIDVSKLHPQGGLLMKQVPKEQIIINPDKSETARQDGEWDSRGFKEQTGPEIFEMICSASIQGANPKCSYDQLKGFRAVSSMLKDATKKGEFRSNKTDIDIIKNSIKGNPNWPNNDELEGVLDSIIEKLDNPKEI